MNVIAAEAPAASDSSTTDVKPRDRHIAIMEDATMAELVTFGRLFFAAINCRHSPDEPYDKEVSAQHDDEMEVLSGFDDELTGRIIAREPKSPEEYGVKAAYLFDRLRRHDMSDDVADEALAALDREARVMAGLPAIPA